MLAFIKNITTIKACLLYVIPIINIITSLLIIFCI